MKNSPKDKLLDSIQYEIGVLEKMKLLCNDIPVNLIAQMFPQGHWDRNWSTILFAMPMSFQLISDFKEAMKIQFPDFELKRDNQYIWNDHNRAGTFLEYQKYDKDAGRFAEFEVSFRSEVKGSTCVLNPIGKETKEVTIYEVVCSEAAANEFTMEKK